MPQQPERFSRANQPEEHPEWADPERGDDLAFLAENLFLLAPAARAQYRERGRGVVVIDTTAQPDPQAGHPVFYLNLDELAPLDEPDV